MEADAGDATPTHSEFGDTDDEKEQPEEDAMEEDDAMEDARRRRRGRRRQRRCSGRIRGRRINAGRARAAHEELVVCLRAVRAASWFNEMARFTESSVGALRRAALAKCGRVARAVPRFDDPSVLMTATTILPREAKLWLELTRIKLNESVDAGAKILEEACAVAERDASGNLGRLFDAARALADDTDDTEKRDALYERELAAPLYQTNPNRSSSELFSTHLPRRRRSERPRRRG